MTISAALEGQAEVFMLYIYMHLIYIHISYYKRRAQKQDKIVLGNKDIISN